jgi:hypothetical protein
MPLYFLLLDAGVFHTRIRPALAASWRQRSFQPCRELCRQLQEQVQAFTQRFQLGSDAPLVATVASAALPFDRAFWQHLAGELLWFSATDIPEISTSPEALCCLLPDERCRRTLFGSHDIQFGGGYYRPDQAGWNDSADVTELADYLAAVRSAAWTALELARMMELADEADRAEELEYVRDWFPALVELYGQAAQRGQIVLCERVE